MILHHGNTSIRLHTQNIATAVFGLTGRVHIVIASSPERYRECLECHHMSDMNFDNANVGLLGAFNLPRSENGSYILPGGIIVLVDADIEAYFTGTLIFSDGISNTDITAIPIAYLMDEENRKYAA